MNIFPRLWRHLPELIGALLILMVHYQILRRLLATEAARRSRALANTLVAAAVVLTLWVLFGFVASLPSTYLFLPVSADVYWLRGAALAWVLAISGAWAVWQIGRRLPKFDSGRRGFLRASACAAVGAPFAVVGFGIFVQRNDLHVREVKIPIPGLPPDLDGLRLVQLSDIHLSPFLSVQELERAVQMANEVKPHLALVTGDLITTRGDALETCIARLAALRADAGILGCLGNHEIYASAEERATLLAARRGIRFLRHQAQPLRFGNATLNVAGVDYERNGKHYLGGCERLIVPGAINLMLSHNPNVFDTAAEQGWNVTLSGHTHGGQINIEILHESLSPARFYTPYVYGLFRKGPASLWVTRGIGTVGVPARIGAPPEIAAIRLCAT